MKYIFTVLATLGVILGFFYYILKYEPSKFSTMTSNYVSFWADIKTRIHAALGYTWIYISTLFSSTEVENVSETIN